MYYLGKFILFNQTILLFNQIILLFNQIILLFNQNIIVNEALIQNRVLIIKMFRPILKMLLLMLLFSDHLYESKVMSTKVTLERVLKLNFIHNRDRTHAFDPENGSIKPLNV